MTLDTATATTLMRERIRQESEDRDGPAGGEPAAARTSLPRYVFVGAGDAHLYGQPCEIVTSGVDGPIAVLACGCRQPIRGTEVKLAARLDSSKTTRRGVALAVDPLHTRPR